MRIRPDELSDQERAEAVREFDGLYREMKKVLWCLRFTPAPRCSAALANHPSLRR